MGYALGMAGLQTRVTIIGYGRGHLETRAKVLQHFWTVKTVALDDGARPSYDTELVVVCHSLPEAERQEWVNRVRQEAPGMLVVKMNGYDSGPHAGADATVDETHGPGALVSTIYELLTERGLASRAWAEDNVEVWLH